MEDRLVQYPNRVRLVQVDGQPGVYDIEAVPGTVTANGTPLNKATLLSDTVATLVNNAATPNEALKYLAERVQPIKLGGTGADLSGAATNAVVCKASSGQNLATVSTAKGAFYSTGANATPKFGTLPIAEGGTGANTVSGVLNNLGLSNALKIQTVNPSNWTIPANSARGDEIKGTIDGYEGYTPIVVVCYCTNAYGVLIINAWVSGSYDASGNGFTWHIDARNVTSSSATANFTLRILWIKNNVLD